MLNLAVEPAGANCAYGGTSVGAGVDLNGDGILQVGEVTATRYICRASAGWVDVTGTSVQAASNTGYIADNAAQVVVTLPASATVGDTVNVTGAGAGGWKIAQNAGQHTLTLGLPGNPSTGLFLATTAPQQNWISTAVSADGKTVVGALDGSTNGFGTSVFQSTDAGATWSNIGGGGGFAPAYLAITANGGQIFDAVRGGQIYITTNGGVSYTANGPSRNWVGIASSADGSHAVAVAVNQEIYLSSDAGVTWTASGQGVAGYSGVACSSDCSHIAVSVNGGGVLVSSDSGLTWSSHSGSQAFVGVSMSSDGSRIAAAVSGGNVLTSSDGGATWTTQGGSGIAAFSAITSSASGKKLAAAVNGGPISVSDDYGVTWTTYGPSRNIRNITMSASGAQIFAGVYNGLIYQSLGNQTSVGTSGFLAGSMGDAVQLQYLGNGAWIVLSYTSNSGAFTIQ